jgi:hypothetical protein
MINSLTLSEQLACFKGQLNNIPGLKLRLKQLITSRIPQSSGSSAPDKQAARKELADRQAALLPLELPSDA